MTKHEEDFYKKLAKEFNYKPIPLDERPYWLSSKGYEEYLGYIEEYKHLENDFQTYFS